MLLLFYDRRRGNRGLSLNADFPEMDLLKGDRVEPCEELPDIGRLESMKVDDFPCRLLFWRASRDSLVRHKNPLFDESIGFTPQNCLCGLAPHHVSGVVPNLVDMRPARTLPSGRLAHSRNNPTGPD